MADIMHQAGQRKTEQEELVDWVQEDFNVPGYHCMTGEEMAGSLQNEPETEDEEEATDVQQVPSLAAGLEAISTCLIFTDNVGKFLAEHN